MFGPSMFDEKPPEGAVLLVRVADSGLGPMVSAEGTALLTGLPVEQVRAAMKGPVTNVKDLPADWLRAGRRRAREAMAHTGTENALVGIWYWAEREQRGQLYQGSDGLYLIPAEGDQGATGEG